MGWYWMFACDLKNVPFCYFKKKINEMKIISYYIFLDWIISVCRKQLFGQWDSVPCHTSYMNGQIGDRALAWGSVDSGSLPLAWDSLPRVECQLVRELVLFEDSPGDILGGHGWDFGLKKKKEHPIEQDMNTCWNELCIRDLKKSQRPHLTSFH